MGALSISTASGQLLHGMGIVGAVNMLPCEGEQGPLASCCLPGKHLRPAPCATCSGQLIDQMRTKKMRVASTPAATVGARACQTLGCRAVTAEELGAEGALICLEMLSHGDSHRVLMVHESSGARGVGPQVRPPCPGKRERARQQSPRELRPRLQGLLR